MNPSSSGWIAKQLVLLKKTARIETSKQSYTLARQTGFIYGISIKLLTLQVHFIHPWTTEEKTKVNLFDALAYSYKFHYDHLEDFIEVVHSFYKKTVEGENYRASAKNELRHNLSALEKIIHTRVQTSDSLIRKKLSAVFTNALLYIDVLTFQHYLTAPGAPKSYAANLEYILLNTIYSAVQQKVRKSEENKLLLDLFKKSLRYHKSKIPPLKLLESLSFENTTPTEKLYILDLTSLFFWDEPIFSGTENHFMFTLAKQLQLSTAHVIDAQKNLNLFIAEHRAVIPYFNPAHPLKHLYDHTNAMVRTLILRNKTRLLKELTGSKDLVLLLGKSTYTDLNRDERKKVREQLIDICKSIPSLAVFLLPGGSVLLPVLIHYIPQLLPSAFNENRIDDPAAES